MAWYHWIGSYLIGIGAIIFTIIPNKPLWLWGVIFLFIITGLLLGLLIPGKEDKYAKKNQEG